MPKMAPRFKPPVTADADGVVQRHRMIQDPHGPFTFFVYHKQALDKITELEQKLADVEAELQIQRDINETRTLLEKEVMKQTEALIYKNLGVDKPITPIAGTLKLIASK